MTRIRAISILCLILWLGGLVLNIFGIDYPTWIFILRVTIISLYIFYAWFNNKLPYDMLLWLNKPLLSKK